MKSGSKSRTILSTKRYHTAQYSGSAMTFYVRFIVHRYLNSKLLSTYFFPAERNVNIPSSSLPLPRLVEVTVSFVEGVLIVGIKPAKIIG